MKLADYESIVFDCDGVLLDSNRVKTEAFYRAVIKYGEPAAQELVDYHKKNGGVSRYKKFEFFFQEVLSEAADEPKMREVLDLYASHCRAGLLECDMAEGLGTLKKYTPKASWFVVSGGDQQELREIFNLRGIDTLFDGGIYGSPDSKELILGRERERGVIKDKALFIGDSRYDHEAASGAGMDFIFVSAWTEFREWQDYCNKRALPSVQMLKDLLAI